MAPVTAVTVAPIILQTPLFTEILLLGRGASGSCSSSLVLFDLILSPSSTSLAKSFRFFCFSIEWRMRRYPPLRQDNSLAVF